MHALNSPLPMDFEGLDGHAQSRRYLSNDAAPSCAMNNAPHLPMRTIDVASHEVALTYLPSLDEHKQNLLDICRHAGTRAPHNSLLLEAEEVGVNFFHGDGPLLIANIPAYLSPHFAELACAIPEFTTVNALDFSSSETLVTLSVFDGHGTKHSVGFRFVIRSLLMGEDLRKDFDSWCLNFVFCCDDKVAFGVAQVPVFDHFWDIEQDIPWGYRTSAELEIGRAKAGAAGSPTPWIGSPWKNEDGSVLTQIPHCTNDLYWYALDQTGLCENEREVMDEIGRELYEQEHEE